MRTTLFKPPTLRTRLCVSSLLIVIIGMAGAIFLYVTAGAVNGSPGSELLEDRQYLHELERYGGKANVLAVEFSQWFGGLWHGRSLAVMVGVVALLLGSGLWGIARLFTGECPDYSRNLRVGGPGSADRTP